jgi:hypothetical protein
MEKYQIDLTWEVIVFIFHKNYINIFLNQIQ